MSGGPGASLHAPPFRRAEYLFCVAFWAISAGVAVWRGTSDLLAPYAAAAAALVALVLIVWRAAPQTRTARFLADWTPFAGVLVSYDMLHTVAPRCWTHLCDPWLRDADRALLGGRDAADVLAPATSVPVTVFLATCYALYYVGPLAAGVWWWFRNRLAFRELMTGEVCVLFTGYLGYLLLPAVGPHAHFDDPAVRTHLVGDWIGPIIRLRNGFHDGHFPRDAFPSLHTANAVTLLLMARRHDRALFRIALVPMVGLIAATVYLRYHYLTDVLAGAALALLFQPAAVALVRRESRRGGTGGPSPA